MCNGIGDSDSSVDLNKMKRTKKIKKVMKKENNIK